MPANVLTQNDKDFLELLEKGVSLDMATRLLKKNGLNWSLIAKKKIQFHTQADEAKWPLVVFDGLLSQKASLLDYAKSLDDFASRNFAPLGPFVQTIIKEMTDSTKKRAHDFFLPELVLLIERKKCTKSMGQNWWDMLDAFEAAGVSPIDHLAKGHADLWLSNSKDEKIVQKKTTEQAQQNIALKVVRAFYKPLAQKDSLAGKMDQETAKIIKKQIDSLLMTEVCDYENVDRALLGLRNLKQSFGEKRLKEWDLSLQFLSAYLSLPANKSSTLPAFVEKVYSELSGIFSKDEKGHLLTSAYLCDALGFVKTPSLREDLAKDGAQFRWPRGNTVLRYRIYDCTEDTKKTRGTPGDILSLFFMTTQVENVEKIATNLSLGALNTKHSPTLHPRLMATLNVLRKCTKQSAPFPEKDVEHFKIKDTPIDVSSMAVAQKETVQMAKLFAKTMNTAHERLTITKSLQKISAEKDSPPKSTKKRKI